MGKGGGMMRVRPAGGARESQIAPGVLAGLIAEIRLQLARAKGSLLEMCDLLDFPGGRALKGINGFGQAELSTGQMDNAIEVYKRGKLTYLFEQFSLDREITALVLCSPGPTKPEAIQMQSQVESWLRIRHGSPTPTLAGDVERPSLFVALTKYDMSLSALRSDNARDRWDSRVQEACVEFWARGASSWLYNWGAKSRPFANMFWVRNPYADQMTTLKPTDPDYDVVKTGYMQSRAVQRHIARFEAKWAAVEGTSDDGLPRSGVPLLCTALRDKMQDDVKARELEAEARAIHGELVSVLRALTPSKDEAEERERIEASARALVEAVDREMRRRASGAVFGDLVRRFVADEDALEDEVRRAWSQVAPMSIKASDKVKRVLVHTLKWWMQTASERLRESDLALPQAMVDGFVREVCTSRQVLPIVGAAIYPYFSRSTVSFRLVARILQVKVTDAMVGLLVDGERTTPAPPVRLSYAEEIGRPGQPGDAIDWSNVDFDADESTPAADVEIIFAGRRKYRTWAEHLGEFYLKNRGSSPRPPADEPRTRRLLAVLAEVERAHGGPAS